MTLLSRLRRAAAAAATELRSSVDVADPRDPVLATWFGGGDGASLRTSPHDVRGLPAVEACVGVIANTIAALPLNVHRVTAGMREPAPEHPLQALLHDAPNGDMTSFEWRDLMVRDHLLAGDHVSRIVTDGASGAVREIWPEPAAHIEVRPRENGRRPTFKIIRPGGRTEVLLPEEVLRAPNRLQPDGRALSPIAVFRQTFGLAVAMREHAAAVMQNNATPKVVLELPADISDEAAEVLRDSWNRRHQGPANAGRVAIADGGMKIHTIGMSPHDAQFVEQMNLSLRDVARIFQVQAHKIGDLERATFSNIEHQAIEFVTDTIVPRVTRIEQRMNRALLTPRERAEGLTIEFDLTALLRGDAASRAAYTRALFSIGAVTPNEVRGRDGHSPLAGGDTAFVQGAFVPLEMAAQGRGFGAGTPWRDPDQEMQA